QAAREHVAHPSQTPRIVRRVAAGARAIQGYVLVGGAQQGQPIAMGALEHPAAACEGSQRAEAITRKELRLRALGGALQLPTVASQEHGGAGGYIGQAARTTQGAELQLSALFELAFVPGCLE